MSQVVTVARGAATDAVVASARGRTRNPPTNATARGVEMRLPLWLRVMGALGTPQFNMKVVR